MIRNKFSDFLSRIRIRIRSMRIHITVQNAQYIALCLLRLEMQYAGLSWCTARIRWCFRILDTFLNFLHLLDKKNTYGPKRRSGLFFSFFVKIKTARRNKPLRKINVSVGSLFKTRVYIVYFYNSTPSHFEIHFWSF